MAFEEGRAISEYILVIWDGTHIAFGRLDGTSDNWDRLTSFDRSQALHLLESLRDQGRPLIHPGLLRRLIGPESTIGAALIPALFRASASASTAPDGEQTKTTLLIKEWSRLFGQTAGVPTSRLQEFLLRQSVSHQETYANNVVCYLFALHTYIAIVAKLVAALALPNPSQNICDDAVSLRERMEVLESGTLFADAGIVNMLGGDFFSWPPFDRSWPTIEQPLQDLLGRLGQFSFDMTRKNPNSVRDLFKGIYEEFVPRELRHALGEVYTPDWLAEYSLDKLGWQVSDDLLDPTCGTGTFILEAVRRRLITASSNDEILTAHEIMSGLYGIDLNPLAVIATKASLVVVLAHRFDPNHPIRLPIFLADAINTASASSDGFFVHHLPTEKGIRSFEVPEVLVRSEIIHKFFDDLRLYVNADHSADQIEDLLAAYMIELGSVDRQKVAETIRSLVCLHEDRWDGIWCTILADRFAAGSIRRVSHIVGNPPWVKWSHLPPAYASFIKPLCQSINVFSEDRYVGGIESDISTIITFQAIRKWLAPGGHLAFFITATVFANESSQGFRRFANADGTPMCAVKSVEDFKEIRAFDGVTNHPALLIVEEGKATNFPVPYRIWSLANGRTLFVSAADFRERACKTDLLAEPVPGTDAGPWLKGTRKQHAVWETLFDAAAQPVYKARKGITTDRNGIYFVRATRAQGTLVSIENNPDGTGRTRGIPRVRMDVEPDHLFPLLRGRGLRAFNINPDPDYKVIVAQRGMHGDPKLMGGTPRTLRFLSRFKQELEKRASYRRFQSGQPFWSTWSTGSYTFAPFKVLWKEMSGGRFCAACIGEVDDTVLGLKVAVPDHKLYMVPLERQEEAFYLTGLLNSRTITEAIGAYASQLSLGISVIEYLRIPRFDEKDVVHCRIFQMSQEITLRGGEYVAGEIDELDLLAVSIIASQTKTTAQRIALTQK